MIATTVRTAAVPATSGYLPTLITDVVWGRVTDTVEARLRAETWRQAQHLLDTGTSPTEVANILEGDLDNLRTDIDDIASEAGFGQDDADFDAWVDTTLTTVRAAIAEFRTHARTAPQVTIPRQNTGDTPARMLQRWDRAELDDDSVAAELYDELDQVADELIDARNTAWYDRLHLKVELFDRDVSLASEIATRTITELTRQTTIGRADVARCDNKALGLASLVSLVGAGVGAVITLTGAVARLGLATAITGGAAALSALVVLGLAAAAMWPASRKNAVVVDATANASLITGLTAERDQVNALADRKFGFLRYALVGLAVTAGLALAAIATAIWI